MADRISDKTICKISAKLKEHLGSTLRRVLPFDEGEAAGADAQALTKRPSTSNSSFSLPHATASPLDRN